MKAFNRNQAVKQAEINSHLRQIRREKYIQNTEQKKIFEHLVKNNLELEIRKPEHAKIITNGVPQVYREIVWPQLLKNNHGITLKFYQSLLKKVFHLTQQITQIQKSQEFSQLQVNKSKSQGYVPLLQINANLQKIEKWFNIIKLDIPRTFLELKIFQPFSGQSIKKKPNQQSIAEERDALTINDESAILFNLLSCWVVYREDIGYRQGMSQIAGYLLIELSNEVTAFQMFCSLITSDSLYKFLTMNVEYICYFCGQVHSLLKKRNKELYIFFEQNRIDYKLFILDWMFSLFTKCFQLDTIGKIWDILLLNAMEQKILVTLVAEIICSFAKEILKFQFIQIEDSIQICTYLKKVKVDQIRQTQILTNLKVFHL